MLGPQSSGRGGKCAFSEHLLANEANQCFYSQLGGPSGPVMVSSGLAGPVRVSPCLLLTSRLNFRFSPCPQPFGGYLGGDYNFPSKTLLWLGELSSYFTNFLYVLFFHLSYLVSCSKSTGLRSAKLLPSPHCLGKPV